MGFPLKTILCELQTTVRLLVKRQMNPLSLGLVILQITADW